MKQRSLVMDDIRQNRADVQSLSHEVRDMKAELSKVVGKMAFFGIIVATVLATLATKVVHVLTSPGQPP